MIEDSTFIFKYEPLSVALDRLNITLRELFIVAMEDNLSLYVVNQSNKALIYAPAVKKPRFSFLHSLFRTDYKTVSYKKGEMIKLQYVKQIDLLAKGVMNELDCFMIHAESREFLVGKFHPLFRWMNLNAILNEFHPITLDHIFIPEHSIIKYQLALKGTTIQEILDEIRQENVNEGLPLETEAEVMNKQRQRELIFYEWLTDKDEHKVSQMKKEEVLAELRKVNPHLFMGDQKHFFRLQKRIIFKSGRKAENDD